MTPTEQSATSGSRQEASSAITRHDPVRTPVTQLLTPSLGLARAAAVAGLLYVWRNAVQAAASFPIGALADRVGHRHLLVIGYAVGVATAALTALAFAKVLPVSVLPMFVVIFGLAGCYTAAEESLEATLTASYIPGPTRGLGFGVVGTVNGIGDFISSAGVRSLWTAGRLAARSSDIE
jgi:MFS family permease